MKRILMTFLALALLVIAAAVFFLPGDIFSRGSAALPSSGEEEFLQWDIALNTYDPALFQETGGFLRYEDCLVGIDVSSHQMSIDWQAVREAGVDFAIIRAAYRGTTNGGLNMDTHFQRNIQGALDAGLQVGVYLFSQAVTLDEAMEEAEFVLQCIGDNSLQLPVYYDWEYTGDDTRTARVKGSEITAFAAAFCQRVETAGYKAGVYFNRNLGYTRLHLPTLREYEFWLAQYRETPDFYFNFQMWQYTDSGTVPGIPTNVDLNIRFLCETSEDV